MKKVIITAKVHEYMIERLSKQGYSVNHQPQITYDDLCKEIENAEGLVVTTRLKIDKNMIDKGSKLIWSLLMFRMPKPGV